MNDLAMIQRLLEYSDWANAEVLNAAAMVSEGGRRRRSMSFFLRVAWARGGALQKCVASVS